MIDWVPELADDDLEVLLEALEAWESKDLSSEMMSEMLDHVLSTRDPLQRAVVQQQREQEKRKRSEDKRLRKERSVLLRAKLITLRDRRRSEAMTHKALSHDRD